ncbi:ABC-2 type transport system permease protein [Pullulanibacillus pueri]|uniref:Uncharacterized protein n=1 Tax=Pullulanibacillus pueri TaxID=1437324 RepID=A0A8J2ZWU2_9BACL|nr:hypothetical protein [Pullulanibacillus pueri]MBM7680659.1 ABC-2 type transport system permease protein [Pullulanibacillus pueri]GGH83818.1 hypothetical protein GCM10007096_25460 [Pullulanibacillus pueri]
MTSQVFWKLVRHEFFAGANRRKGRKNFRGRKARITYYVVMLLLFFAVMTVVTMKTHFSLNNSWFCTLGFPYFVFFWGFGAVKREWDNETLGWWLTLPYRRETLLSAKLIANLIQIVLFFIGLMCLAVIYSTYLTCLQDHFHWSEISQFMRLGFNWIIIMLFFSPFLLAAGQFLVVAQHTLLSFMTPILWILCMWGGSFLYWFIVGNNQNNVFMQMSEGRSVSFFPYTHTLWIYIVLSWVLSYVILRVTAYLLDKKLSL